MNVSLLYVSSIFRSNILEKNVGLLLEGVDHLLSENSKLTNHQKRIQRLQSDRIRIVQRKVTALGTV